MENRCFKVRMCLQTHTLEKYVTRQPLKSTLLESCKRERCSDDKAWSGRTQEEPAQGKEKRKCLQLLLAALIDHSGDVQHVLTISHYPQFHLASDFCRWACWAGGHQRWHQKLPFHLEQVHPREQAEVEGTSCQWYGNADGVRELWRNSPIRVPLRAFCPFLKLLRKRKKRIIFRWRHGD